MELKPVLSSNLQAVGHDAEKQELLVEFKGGGLYAYDGVPSELYEELIKAKSIGSYFSKEIKDKFKYRKLK